VVVVLEFCQWQEVYPVILPLVDEEAKVLFQFLIDTFRLPVTLWMIGRGSGDLNSENVVEFPCEFCHELRTSVRHHLPRKSVVLPDVLDEQPGGSDGGDSNEGRHEVSCLGHGIYHYHHCVMTRRFWELDDEVYANGVPRSVGNRKRVELSDRRTSLGLRSHAQVTGRSVLPNIPGHLRPPVVPGDEL
jgi:hypothetical protein